MSLLDFSNIPGMRTEILNVSHSELCKEDDWAVPFKRNGATIIIL